MNEPGPDPKDVLAIVVAFLFVAAFALLLALELSWRSAFIEW